MPSSNHPPESLGARPTFLLAQLGVHTTEQFARLLTPLDIAPRHVAVLNTLSHHAGITQQQLCEVLHIHRNVMVGMVDDLERRGLVERRRHPTQRRAHALHLLAAGSALLEKAEHILNGYEAELFASWEPQDRHTLLRLLQQLTTPAGVQGLNTPESSGCAAEAPQ